MRSLNDKLRRHLKKIFPRFMLMIIMCMLMIGCKNKDQAEINTTSNQNEGQIKESIDQKISNQSSDQKESDDIDSNEEKVDKEESDDNEAVQSDIEEDELENQSTVTGNNSSQDKELLEKSEGNILSSNKVHNIFKGNIDKEEVILDLFIEKNNIYICYIGEDRTKEVELSGKVINQSIVAKNDDHTILFNLKSSESNEFSGECYIEGVKRQVSIHYCYTIGGTDMDQRYLFSKEEKDIIEIEEFVQKIIDEVNNEEIAALSDLIEYPITVTSNNNKITYYEKPKDLNDIFTSSLRMIIKTSFSKFMYNTNEGIRIGNRECNIWITKIDGKDWKIISINN